MLLRLNNISLALITVISQENGAIDESDDGVEKCRGIHALGKIKRMILCFLMLVSGETILIPILNIALNHS